MSLKSINESFKKLSETYADEDYIDPDYDLRTALIRAWEQVGRTGTMNLKEYEIAYQDVIEKFFPEHSWWEVCHLNIFEDLFNGRDPKATIDHIMDSIDKSKDLYSKDSKIDDIEFVMKKYVNNSIYFDYVRGSGTHYTVSYNNELVDVDFDPNYDEYVYTLNGEGPYSHRSYEFIESDIMDFVDSNAKDNKGQNGLEQASNKRSIRKSKRMNESTNDEDFNYNITAEPVTASGNVGNSADDIIQFFEENDKTVLYVPVLIHKDSVLPQPFRYASPDIGHKLIKNLVDLGFQFFKYTDIEQVCREASKQHIDIVGYLVISHSAYLDRDEDKIEKYDQTLGYACYLNGKKIEVIGTPDYTSPYDYDYRSPYDYIIRPYRKQNAKYNSLLNKSGGLSYWISLNDEENFNPDKFNKFIEEEFFPMFVNDAIEIVESEGYTDVEVESSVQAGSGLEFFSATDSKGNLYTGSYPYEKEIEELGEIIAQSSTEEEAIKNATNYYAEIILDNLKMDESLDENKTLIRKITEECCKRKKKSSLIEAPVATMERPMTGIQGTLSSAMQNHKDELSQVYDKQTAIDFLDIVEPEVKNKGYLSKVKDKISRMPNGRVASFLYNIILKGDGLGTNIKENKSHRVDQSRINPLNESVGASVYSKISDKLYDMLESEFEDGLAIYLDSVIPEYNAKWAPEEYNKNNILQRALDKARLDYIDSLTDVLLADAAQ